MRALNLWNLPNYVDTVAFRTRAWNPPHLRGIYLTKVESGAHSSGLPEKSSARESAREPARPGDRIVLPTLRSSSTGYRMRERECKRSRNPPHDYTERPGAKRYASTTCAGSHRARGHRERTGPPHRLGKLCGRHLDSSLTSSRRDLIDRQ